MNTIQFGSLRREYQKLKIEIDHAVQAVLNSGCFLFGNECNSFEKAFADYCGTPYCVGVASGTDALMLSLMVLDVQRSDFVITVPNTAMPTVSAISMVGAEPIFVDIEETTMLMDPEKLKALLRNLPTATLKKVKAIVPVHLYGLICEMDKIKAIAEEYGIPIIEDCAHAHGASYGQHKAGTIGLLGCYSFYPSKNLGCYGDGGSIITSDETLYNRLTMLRNYGQRTPGDYHFIGVNSRLAEIQAAILNVKLNYLESWNNKRRYFSTIYRKELSGCPILFQEIIGHDRKHVYHLLVIRTSDRDGLKSYLTQNQIQTRVHYPNLIYRQSAYNYLAYNEGECEIAEAVSREILSLPIGPFMKSDEILTVTEKITDYFE